MSQLRRLLLAVLLAIFVTPMSVQPALAAVEGSPRIQAMVVGDDEFRRTTAALTGESPAQTTRCWLMDT